MAQYKTGTISVTNGSPIVTGSGTNWLSAGINPSDFLIADGDAVAYLIASVDADTQITLNSNYAGTTRSGIAYTAHTDRYQSLPIFSDNDADTAELMNEVVKYLVNNTQAAAEALGRRAVFGDLFNDFVISGGLPATSVNLTTDTPAAVAYVSGLRVSAPEDTARAYTASVDTYVDLGQDGTFSYTEVPNGDPAPTIPADHIRLALVVTDADNITGVTDLRPVYLPKTRKHESLAALVRAVESGAIAVGSQEETSGYYGGWAATASGVPKGGNTYELIDAGSPGARPAEDNGSVIHCTGGSGGLYLKGLFISGRIDDFQFGSVSDNAADDTSSITNLISYVSSLGGGTAFLPASTGRRRITGNIQVPANVTLQGDGVQGATFIEAVNDGFVAITLAGVGAQIRDIFINCASATGANFAVEIAVGANRAYIDRSKIFGYGNGLRVRGGIFVISDMEVTGFSVAAGVGVDVDVPTGSAEIGEFRNLFVEGNASFRPAAALRLTQCSGIQVSNGDLMQCARGIQFASDSGLSRGVTSIKCTNTYFDSNTLANVEFLGDNTNRVDLSSCWASSGQYGIIFADGSITRGLTVTGGEIYDNSLIGFQKRDAATVTDLQINGTKFAGNGEDCRLGSASEFTISSVQTGALGGFSASPTGFVIEADCSDYMLVANNFHDITDNGTAKKRGYNKGLVTENFGTDSVTSDANGNFTIAHGLVDVPDYADLNVIGDTATEAEVQSVDSTNITGRLRNTTTNADVATTTNVMWKAAVN